MGVVERKEGVEEGVEERCGGGRWEGGWGKMARLRGLCGWS